MTKKQLFLFTFISISFLQSIGLLVMVLKPETYLLVFESLMILACQIVLGIFLYKKL